MTAEAEQKQFWDIYEQILMENGEPFFLAPNGEADGAPCRYVQRNGENSFADRRIGVDFIPRSKTVIYGVFLDNDAGLFRSLLGRKAAIERELGFRCTWQYDEEKGVYRIVCEAEIDPFDRNGYAGAIENSIFSLTKFWEVFTPLFEREEKSKTRCKEEHVVKTLRTGDLFRGSNFTDMLNNALGTRYKQFMKCWISLKALGGREEGRFWLVFMDGSVHGVHKNYLWRNILSPDGNTIEEECVAEDRSEIALHVPQGEVRVALRRDPFASDDKYLCEFVGVFRIAGYRENKDSFVRIYKKIADTYSF